ncbi:hypothetical protein [Halosimplex halobium]
MIRAWLRARLLADRPERVHECRRCGATVDAGCERCPTCGHQGIATYEVG